MCSGPVRFHPKTLWRTCPPQGKRKLYPHHPCLRKTEIPSRVPVTCRLKNSMINCQVSSCLTFVWHLPQMLTHSPCPQDTISRFLPPSKALFSSKLFAGFTFLVLLTTTQWNAAGPNSQISCPSTFSLVERSTSLTQTLNVSYIPTIIKCMCFQPKLYPKIQSSPSGGLLDICIYMLNKHLKLNMTYQNLTPNSTLSSKTLCFPHNHLHPQIHTKPK